MMSDFLNLLLYLDMHIAGNGVDDLLDGGVTLDGLDFLGHALLFLLLNRAKDDSDEQKQKRCDYDDQFLRPGRKTRKDVESVNHA